MSQRDAPQPQRKVETQSPAPFEAPELAAPALSPLSLVNTITRPDKTNLTSDVVSRLQRTHGNRFVQRLVQRAHKGSGVLQRDVIDTPTQYQGPRNIARMTLGDFHQHAQDQVDWFNGPNITPEQRGKYTALLEFARRQHVLAGCREMRVNSLLVAGLVTDRFDIDYLVSQPLEVYSAGVAHDASSINVEQQTNVNTAVRWGRRMAELQNALGGELAHHSVNQEGFEGLLTGSRMQEFIDYFHHFSPNLEDPEGGDVLSYIALRREGVNPMSYVGGVLDGKIKNFHRFTRAALDRLVRNYARTGVPNGQRKPLTLIIHSSSDHNSAFHRDPELTAVITSQRSTTLLMEVITSLGDVEAAIPTLAAAYGKNGQIDQVMFAGHGNARSLELMPDQGANPSQNLDLDENADATNSLFDTLVSNMANDPATSTFRRIVFNACLTNSNEVTLPTGTTWDPDATTQAQQARQAITDNPAFATYLRNRIGASSIRVVGANGSISTVRLMDRRGGLDIITAADPEVTNPDKLAYVEHGTEPEGVLRAVMECWSGFAAADAAARQQSCFDAMQRRVNLGNSTDWTETVIRTIFSIILARHRDNAGVIQHMGLTAYLLSELVHASECKVSKLDQAGLMPTGELASEAVTLFTALARTARWGQLNYVRLVVEQVWMMHDPSHQAAMMQVLRTFDGQSVSPSHGSYLHPSTIMPNVGSLLSGGATPPREQLLLACKLARVDEPTALAFLRTVIGAGNLRFPAALNINTILQGNPDEQVVLQHLNLAAANTDQRANLDLDQDGTNETFVEPTPGMRGASVIGPTVVFERPDTSSARLTPQLTLDQMVHVSGKTGTFYAIEHSAAPSGIGFVEQSQLLPM